MNIRLAQPRDAEEIATVEAESWPASLAADRTQVAARLAAAPEGQLVAEIDGRIVAVAWSQRVSRRFFAETPAQFDQLPNHGTFTDTHDPNGEIYQLIGVGVSPVGRGARLGRQLVDAQLELARNLPGVERILGFTRPVGYAARHDVPIEEYVRLKSSSGRWTDPMLAFHLGAGAKLVSIHAQFRPADVEAAGYGILIEYPR